MPMFILLIGGCGVLDYWSNGVVDSCAGWKLLSVFLPTFAALADKLGGLVCRIHREQVAHAELVADGILQRLLIETLRGGEIRKRVQHRKEEPVSPRIVRAPKHGQHYVVPAHDAGDARPPGRSHVLRIAAGVS